MLLGRPACLAARTSSPLLETMGLISVTRYQVGRVITILSSGKSTAPMTGKLHWSVRGVVRRQSRPPIISTNPETSGTYRGPVPENQRVYRDPCQYCGARADVGCHHSPHAAVSL
jgi:hypothetical protein